MTLKMNNFNPIRNQNYLLFFQNSPFASSFWPLNKGLFLPRLLGPKRLHSKWATLAPKLGLYFTHQNGPIFGAKTDLLDLECRLDQLYCIERRGLWSSQGTLGSVDVIYCQHITKSYLKHRPKPNRDSAAATKKLK